MYNYYESMKEDVLDYIRNEVNAEDYTDRDELESFLNDELWIEDSVTGNGSGSYTFDRVQASLYVLDNMDLLNEAIDELDTDREIVGDKFLSEDWEWFDVVIRCYCLGSAISDALDEIEDELTFSEE